MKNPIKMDDLGVPLFLETPKYLFLDMIFWDQKIWTCRPTLPEVRQALGVSAPSSVANPSTSGAPKREVEGGFVEEFFGAFFAMVKTWPFQRLLVTSNYIGDLKVTPIESPGSWGFFFATFFVFEFQFIIGFMSHPVRFCEYKPFPKHSRVNLEKVSIPASQQKKTNKKRPRLPGGAFIFNLFIPILGEEIFPFLILAHIFQMGWGIQPPPTSWAPRKTTPKTTTGDSIQAPLAINNGVCRRVVLQVQVEVDSVPWVDCRA